MSYIFEFSYDFDYEKNVLKKQIDRQEVIAETKDEIAYKKNWSNEAIGTICKKGRKKITSSSNNEIDTIDVFNCRSINTYCASFYTFSEDEDLTDEFIEVTFNALKTALREYVVGQIMVFDEKVENCVKGDVVKTWEEEETTEDDEDEEETDEENE